METALIALAQQLFPKEVLIQLAKDVLAGALPVLADALGLESERLKAFQQQNQIEAAAIQLAARDEFLEAVGQAAHASLEPVRTQISESAAPLKPVLESGGSVNHISNPHPDCYAISIDGRLIQYPRGFAPRDIAEKLVPIGGVSNE